MSFTNACCTLPPVTSKYTPTGEVKRIGELEVYETGDLTSKIFLICAYDIFGVHPNIRQVSDILGIAGFRVIIPDFFRGNVLDMVNFNLKSIKAFIDAHGNWSKTVKADFQAVIEHYKSEENISSFGIFGFCWGGRISIDAATELPEICAAALIHPSMWKTEDAEGIKCPTLLLPARDENDMVPFWEILKKNLGEDKAGHRRFNDMDHGFCGARGNFDEPLNNQRVNEVINLMKGFFTKNVTA